MQPYVQELYDCQTGQTVQITVDFDAKRLTVVIGAPPNRPGRDQVTKQTFASRAELEAEYLARARALMKERNLRDFDNALARVANLARMKADAKLREPARHPALAKLPDEVEYVIGIEIGEGGRTRHSKIGGDPDLPVGVKWPGQRMFVAQIELAEVKPLDVSKWLPSSGMIYYFANEQCTDNVALYAKWRGAFARRRAPPKVKAMADRFYRSDLVERRLSFQGALMREGEIELDEGVVARLTKKLGVELSLDAYDARIFGEPTCEVGVSVFRPDGSGDPDEQLDYDGPYQLALQLPFSNGFLYLGVPPTDLRRGKLERARATYWGT